MKDGGERGREGWRKGEKTRDDSELVWWCAADPSRRCMFDRGRGTARQEEEDRAYAGGRASNKMNTNPGADARVDGERTVLLPIHGAPT